MIGVFPGCWASLKTWNFYNCIIGKDDKMHERLLLLDSRRHWQNFLAKKKRRHDHDASQAKKGLWWIDRHVNYVVGKPKLKKEKGAEAWRNYQIGNNEKIYIHFSATVVQNRTVMHWPPKAITFFSGGEKEVEESKKKSIMLPAKGNRKSYCSSKKVKLQFRRKG